MNIIESIIKKEIKRQLKEISLNRLISHVNKEGKTKSFGIITAFRSTNDLKTNLLLNKQLESDIKKLNLGFFKLKGHWQECTDSNYNYNDCPTNLKIHAIEISLFIPNINKKQLSLLTKKYDQDASIYSGVEVDNKIALIYKNNTYDIIATKMTSGIISQAYSELKGKTFVFENNYL
jgi:hypothetical protein